jgi:hypothetical protein
VIAVLIWFQAQKWYQETCSLYKHFKPYTKTQEMMFSTQLVKPNTTSMFFNGTDITIVKKWDILASQLMKNYVFKHMCNQWWQQPRKWGILYKVLCTSVPSLFLICYLKVILYLYNTLNTYILTSIYASDKKHICKLVKGAIKLGIEHPDVDALMTTQTKTLALRYIHDEDHVINEFLNKCSSRRYRTIKVAWWVYKAQSM